MVTPSSLPPYRRCIKCHRWQFATEAYFPMRTDKPNRLSPVCLECTIQPIDPQKAKRNSFKQWQQSDRGRKYYHDRYRANPNRVKSHAAVQQAIKRGEIPPISAQQCADCGKQAIQYHHESYLPDDWLKVIPLCRPCHTRRHQAKEKEGIRYYQKKLF